MAPEQILTMAGQAMQRGDWPSAERILHDGLTSYPGHAELLSMMAIAVFRSGRPEQALEWFRRAAESGNRASDWANLGSALCDFGRFEEAHEALRKALAAAPSDAFTHFCLARALHGMGRSEEALDRIGAAIEAEPGDTGFRLLRAEIAAALDLRELASTDIDWLLQRRIGLFELLQSASLMLQVGRFGQALALYRSLAASHPDQFDAWLGVCLASERANDLAGLRQALERARSLASNPVQAAAVEQMRGKLAFRNGGFDEACGFFASAWAFHTDNARWKSQIGFDYCQSLDKAGRFADALRVCDAAHALQAAGAESNAAQEARAGFLQMLRKPAVAASGSVRVDDGRADPVFVVGFPRSGTTLLELILDSRPGLVSFDEKPYLVKTLMQYRSSGLAYPESLSMLDVPRIKRLRNAYFDQLAVDGVDPQARPVDKNPLNWAYLPLVRALFPGAHVILALRHPLDVVLSCYMQNLRSAGNLFSSVARIAELYAEMVDYWQRLESALDLPVLVSRYEDLVSDPEAGTRRIAEFLDLPWDAGWLDNSTHARGKAIIHTPSYAQVLEPLNTRAMGRWRNYRDLFDPAVLDVLRPAAESMGYSLD
jgi:tetratricopeptide (TPR) repeat protein